MKPTSFRNRLFAGQPKPKEEKKEVVSDTPPGYDPHYKREVAIVFTVSHIIFVLIISAWHLHPYIFNPSGFGYLIYLFEIPASLVIGLIGLTPEKEPVLPYFGAFFINTIIYGFIGYLLGQVFQTYEIDKELERLSKSEEEVYEENI
jgi:hypothetical protein